VPGSEPGPGMMLIERAGLVSRDMDAIVAMVREQYADHRPQFRYTDPARARASLRTATAGPLTTGRMCWQGIEYRVSDAHADGRLLGVVAAGGSGKVSLGRDELHFTRGDVFLDPPFQRYSAVLRDCGFEVVQIPWSAAAEVAAEHTGLPAASLRFESMSPVSGQAAVRWSQTVTFCSQQLLNTGTTEVSPILVQELTRMTAAVLLGAFPNTIMTSSYLPGPGWVPSSAARHAAEFIETHASQPLTLSQIAAASGVTARALQYAFRRHYGTTPTGYLRQVRLDRAHQELRTADPAAGLTVQAVARRWGWSDSSKFTVAYQQQYGQVPSRTLRT
jgi:AraC-like DNA-binding protein